MSALDAANAHPLAAAKLAEWGVEVEEDLLFLEPADIGELCSLMPKIPSRKFVVLMEKVRAAAASESPGPCVSFFPQQCVRSKSHCHFCATWERLSSPHLMPM